MDRFVKGCRRNFKNLVRDSCVRSRTCTYPRLKPSPARPSQVPVSAGPLSQRIRLLLEKAITRSADQSPRTENAA